MRNPKRATRNEAVAQSLAQVERDIVSDGRPCGTIGEMTIPTMQSGICFNGPKPAGTKNKRKTLVVLGKKC
jgi:hypothetical protein